MYSWCFPLSFIPTPLGVSRTEGVWLQSDRVSEWPSWISDSKTEVTMEPAAPQNDLRMCWCNLWNAQIHPRTRLLRQDSWLLGCCQRIAQAKALGWAPSLPLLFLASTWWLEGITSLVCISDGGELYLGYFEKASKELEAMLEIVKRYTVLSVIENKENQKERVGRKLFAQNIVNQGAFHLAQW